MASPVVGEDCCAGAADAIKQSTAATGKNCIRMKTSHRMPAKTNPAGC